MKALRCGQRLEKLSILLAGLQRILYSFPAWILDLTATVPCIQINGAPGTVKLWESPGRAGGLPKGNHLCKREQTIIH